MSAVLTTQTSPASPTEAPIWASLEALSAFTGTPGQYWPAFLRAILPVIPASDAVLYTRPLAEAGAWREAFVWPATSTLPAALKAARAELERMGDQVERAGLAEGADGRLLGARLEMGEASRAAMLVTRLAAGQSAREAETRLRLLVAKPLLYVAGRALELARGDAARFALALDLGVQLDATERFPVAAMILCNEVAARHRCERVSLGWLEHGRYVRLCAMSHTEKWERRVGVASALELAMDEAVDQDEELGWPAAGESGAVLRDHEAYAQVQACGHLLTFPLRVGGEAVAALTLERAEGEFAPAEVQTLRLVCDSAVRRLHSLRRRDRWWGARLLSAARERAASLLGAEHTLAKVAVVAAATMLAAMLFARVPYRVEAPFILRSDLLAQVPAPFDGFLDEAPVRLGQSVRAGQVLVTLDVGDLLLQEAGTAAERQRFLAEALQAEGSGDVAAMLIAKAGAEEARTRLELTQHRLAQAHVLAPFDGVVVEGDLRERLQAPVKQGEVLMKVARTDSMWVELAVPERLVTETRVGQRGEIAFASRPHASVPIRVGHLEPVAEVREGSNIFIVRGDLAGTPEPWWRPGMSGVGKLDAGRRSPWWIFTHRTVDFLRLTFWW